VLISSGWAEQDDVARLGEVVPGGQGREVVAADAGLVVEHELVQCLARLEPGGADAQLCPGGVRAATSRSRTATR
jgi:hypothetical protein